MNRTYKPHIKSQVGPRYNSLIGWIDFSSILKGTDWRWYECVGHGAAGNGKTPKEAYDSWYRDFLRPFTMNATSYAAYRLVSMPR